MQFYLDDENILYIDCHNNLQKAVKLVNKFEWFKFEVFLLEPNLHPFPFNTVSVTLQPLFLFQVYNTNTLLTSLLVNS